MPPQATTPETSIEDKTQILRLLQENHRELHAAVAGLSDAQAAASPGPERWSVLECLEHLITVEQVVIDRLRDAASADAPAADKEREAALLARVADRSDRVQAPERVRPSGRFRSLSEALESYNAARADTLRFVEENHSSLYSRSLSHPRLGALNGYEYVLIIAGHGRRHTAQILETRAAVAAN
jgi:DinB superfamily